jgi:hypothetical protein
MMPELHCRPIAGTRAAAASSMTVAHLRLLAVFLIALVPSVLPRTALAVEPVSGRYLSAFGRTVTLEYRIIYPPPASVIIEQYFPPGHEIVSADPMPQKYSSKLGKMKWIFKDLQPGSHIIAIEFNWPVQASDIQASLRYRYPGRGLYTETTVLP